MKQRTVGLIIAALFAIFSTLVTPPLSDAAATSYRVYEYFEGLPDDYKGKNNDWEGSNFNSTYPEASDHYSMGAKDITTDDKTYTCVGWKDGIGTNVPASGSARSLQFALKSDVAITWIYKEAHILTIKSKATTGSGTNAIWGAGHNDSGQLGNGTTTTNYTLKKILERTASLPDDYTVLSVGVDNHVAAIKADGTLWTWGKNNDGKLGDGTTTHRETPVHVYTNLYFTDVAAGSDTTAVIRNDGTLWTWGKGKQGQLGNGEKPESSHTAEQVGKLHEWRSVTAGRDYFMAIRNNGSLWAWGENNNGRLGYSVDGDENQPTPKRVGAAADKWRMVAAGNAHSAGIKEDGSLWLWGWNNKGQVGNRTKTDVAVPEQVMLGSRWKSVSPGYSHTLAVREDGTLWAWGENADYRQATDSSDDVTFPRQIGDASNWRTVAAGRKASMAIKEDGSLYAWGTGPFDLQHKTAEVTYKTPTKIGTEKDWLRLSLAKNEGDLETIMAIRSTNRIEATPHLGTRTLVAGEKYAITAKVVPTDGSHSYYLSSYTDGSGNISPATGASYQIPLTLTKNSSVTWSNAPLGASHSVTVNFIDGVPEAVMNSAGFLPSKGTLSIPDGNFTFSAPLTVDVDGSLWEYDGWSSGTGDVPSTGSTNSFTVKLSKASSIMWKYKKRADNAVSFSFSAAGKVPYSEAGFKLSKQVNGNWHLVSDETNGNAPKTFSFDQDTPIKLTANATVTISGTIYTCTGISIESPNYKAPVTTTLNGDTKEFTLTLNDTANSNKSWNLKVNIIYEVATSVKLGHAVTLPQGCMADPATLYGRVTLERPGNQSDTKDNAFHWTDGTFYPVRPVTLFKVLCDNNIVTNYFAEWGTPGQDKVVVAAPVNLNPTSGYKLEQIHYSESYDYGMWPTKLDQPIQPLKIGKTLLRFSDATSSPKFLTFNVVAATPETSAATCAIGQAILPTSGQSHTTPYIYYEKAHYDAAVYDRGTRSGDIIPVNTNVAKLPEQDMIVAWYAAGNAGSAVASKIYWPLTGNLIKYDCKWPATAQEIVVPGPGHTLTDEQKTGSIYNQPDSTLPGYNPNEEHAFLQGDRIHALRTDLNNANSSESWVLLKYKATGTQKWVIQPYKVKNTGLLEYTATAGTLIQPPSPLNLLPPTDASRHKTGDTAGNDWYFKDHKGGHWAKAGKSDSNQSKIVMQWFYPLQTGFYYPPDFKDDTGAPVKVGDPVPFQNGGEKHSDPPKNITYKVSWPATAPVLNIGETLTVAKKGLPAVSAMAAVKKIFDEGETKTPLTTVAQLFDPYSERSTPLDSLPTDINKEDKGSFIEFIDLPYVLRSRLLYDATAKKLIFKGISVDSVTGEPLLLSNIMSEKERDRIISIAKGASWEATVAALYNQARTPLYTTESGVQQALSAGNAGSAGYVVLAENDDESLGSAPVALHVLKVEGGPSRGEIRVIKSDNPFDEKLTLRHSGDFAGVTDNIYYSWYYQPDNGGNQPHLPVTGDMAGWVQYKTGKGLNDITIEGAGKLTLEDNWFIVRYYYGDDPKTATVFDPLYPALVDSNTVIQPSGVTDISLITNNWSAWAGAPGGETAQLAEGWIKRVVSDLNPLDARVADFRNNETNTTVSMISQVGQRYNGAIALNGSADNINTIGLIEAYQTVLDRGESLSIKSSPPVDSSATNTALLNAATRIADFYTMLGNEAYMDSEDPTVSFDTHSGQAGAIASSIYAFQNQVDSLLEEELTLLRGRDNTASTTQAAPFYNRLIWNFTNGDGELAYVQTYNIGDRNIDGFINEADAKIMYPQGHGDAWGHYLTAMTTWYGLLRNPDYTWVPRSESVLVGGSPVPVDYLDERKFARTAAYKAHTGAETVDFTYRKLYVDDPAKQYQGYKDTLMVTQNGAQAPRAWGVDDWARRAGQGAYFDWVTANAMIPAEDKVNVGIKKIDRTTLPELNQIIGHFIRMQFRADQADVGYNPLGLARGVVPFDIDPYLLTSVAGREAQGHFEQIYGRAVKALENAGTAYDYAAQYSEMLRKNEDTLDRFKKQLIDMEWDYKNQLIELFGYPYSGDIGSGKTYPSGYDGPDLFHYNYMDVPKLTGLEEESNTITYKATFKLDTDDKIKFEKDGLKMETQTLDVSYPIRLDMPWKFDIPDGWGERRAPGEIQMALQELIRTNASYKQSLSNYAVTLKEIESATELLQAVYGIKKDQVTLKEKVEGAVIGLETAVMGFKEIKLALEAHIKFAEAEAEAILEGMPKIVGTAIDPTFAARLVIDEAKAVDLGIMQGWANFLEGTNTVLEFTVRRLETATELEVFINDARVEVKNLAVELQRKAESILPMIPDMYAQQAAMQESLNRYKAALAKGLVLLDAREYDRTVASGDITEYRYQDFAFRTFRNDAVQKYRTTFNLASRYAYLAAAAYDYETNLLRSDTNSGANVLATIFQQLSPGVINNGVPLAGGGLADVLARLNQNFGVYKTQLGFNNPQTETTPFSLRSGLFRIRPDASSTASWQEELSKYKVANLNDYPSFNRYCRPFAENSNVAQPGLVIPFSTEIRFGKNFFGFPLGSGDSSYDPSKFATKIHSVGLWFKGYKNAGLANTPRAYLVPVGMDVLRSPSGNSFEERHWQVVDQKLPVPFPMTASEIADASFIPIHNTLSDVLGGIRKFSSIRAYDDDQSIDGMSAAKLAQMNTDSGLVGRSVWNNQWLLIIPGGYLLNDPAAGLDNFINNVSDIRLYFQTYSYSGN